MNVHQTPGADFVQYCARLYNREGVGPICILLQDRDGLNVNCILLCAWAAKLGYRLTSAFWEKALDAIRVLESEAVRPIRAVRRSVSRNDGLDLQLRAGLKRMLFYAELRAEQAVELELHTQMLRHALREESDAVGNALAYAGQASPELLQLMGLLSESGRTRCLND